MGDLILDSERMPLALVPVSIAGRTVGFCLLNKDDFLRIVYSCAEDPIEKTLNTPGRILYCHHRHSKSRGLGRGWSVNLTQNARNRVLQQMLHCKLESIFIGSVE